MMYQANFSVYLGHEDEESFIGFSAEGGLFIVLKVDEGLTKEKGRELLKKMSVEIEQTPINNLNDFDTYLVDQIKQADIPAGFSCAAGFLHDGILFLKTVGTGQIYLRRGSQFAKLIEGTNSASGYVSANDFLVFTTEEFIQVFGAEDQLKNIFDHQKPHDIVETITPQLKTQNDTGIIALFVNLEEERPPEVELKEQLVQQPERGGFRDKVFAFVASTRTQFQTQDRKKTWTFVAVAIILIIFIWSVLLGYQRRVGSQSQKKIKTTRELITEKLESAQEVAFLNLPRATVLINEAKTELTALKRQVKDPNNKDIQSLEKLIADKEGAILKKEERTAAEYFDLSVENKNAKGSKMYLDGESLAILDPQGTAYVLSLSGKSLDRRDSSAAKGASIITHYQDKIYVYRKGVGIFEITPAGKNTKVIDNDKDWKDVVDLNSYNGNLYLLDRGGDEVYKYLVAEKGFSQKNSYFAAGQKPDLENATSLAIDAFVYLGLPRGVFKYVSGAQDNFNPALPEEDSRLTKIFTSKDIEKVYGWDKAKGALYVIDKSGSYERQINSEILKKGSDFVVLGTNAYVLSGSKIYRISVE